MFRRPAGVYPALWTGRVRTRGAAVNGDLSAASMLRADETAVGRSSLWGLWPYCGPHRGLLAGGLALNAAARVFDLLPAIIAGLVVDAVTRALSGGDASPGTFWMLGLAVLGAFAGLALCQCGSDYLLGAMAQKVRHDLRIALYGHLQQLDMAFYESRRTGDLLAVVSNDVDNLESFLAETTSAMVRVVITFAGTFGFLLWVDWRLALLLAAPLPFVIAVIGFFSRKVQPRYRQGRQAVGEINSLLETTLQGMGIVQAYTAEREEAGRIRRHSLTYRDAAIAAAAIRARFVPLIYLIAGASYALLIAGGGWLVLSGDGPGLGAYTTFMLMAVRLIQPVFLLGMVSNQVQRAEASARRIQELFRVMPRIRENPDARPLIRPPERIGALGVTFAYADGEEVLGGIDLELWPGRMVGVVGPTGAGKSTLIKLFLRYYAPTSGAILADGAPIDELKLRDYRGCIGYVSQEPYLFFGSVAENIRLGSPGASIAQVEEAARTAGAHEFIQALPDGYESLIGERGVKLSGGQRQRISLARAVLRDPALLILDEATSAVDTRTEQSIQQNLERFREGRMILAVAHRLSTVRHSDEIVVLAHGRIMERGRHEELVARRGLYFDLWSVQNGEGEARE